MKCLFRDTEYVFRFTKSSFQRGKKGSVPKKDEWVSPWLEPGCGMAFVSV